jgi:phosphate transport system permease protein
MNDGELAERETSGGPPEWLLHAVGGVAVAAVLAPVLWMLVSLSARASLGGDVARAVARGALGSLELCALAGALGLPLGIATGSALAALPDGRLARFGGRALDALGGVPGIVLGVVVYGLGTLPMGGLPSLASAAALALVVLPRVARDTTDLLRCLPAGVHEVTAGLGARPLRITWLVLARTLRRGLAGSTTVALVVAFGEVAPVLFTSVARRDASWDGPLPPLAIEAFQAVHAADASAEGRAAALSVVLALVAIPLGAAGRRMMRRQA